MTKNKWLVIGGVAVLCLLLCLCVSMCGTGSSNTDAPITPSASATEAARMTYTIELKSESGQPLPEIGVYVYTDSSMAELVWFARTDAEGKLSFEDAASDAFVAVLTDVPAGYLAEDYYLLTGERTEIVLAAGLMEGDLNNLNYKLGDVMLDFTVTDSDGKEYKLTELLEQKKAIVLNFWYLQCAPCKSEFPYLQDAYSQYSDDVAVLAMNPVNADSTEIAAFRKDNGYTFPMAACDPAWEKALSLTAYPTTVVIDRFGNICFIHKGSVTEAGIFEAIFGFYAAEGYEQTIFKDLDELMEAAGVEQTVGTKENPVEMGVTPSFQVTVGPEQMMYYNIYRMTTTMYMSVQSEHAYVIYNGKTYYPANGRVNLSVSAEDTNSACSVVFGNSSKEKQTFTVTLGTAPGTMGNPYRMTIGQFTANVGAGNETGVWYTYTPAEDGLFSIEMESVTAGVNYDISLSGYTKDGVGTVQRSLSSEGFANEETGRKFVAINGYAGKPIQITIGTLPDSTNTYPAATFQLLSTFEEGESLDSLLKEKVTYSVNVTDENRKPIAGIMLDMMVGEKNVTIVTDEKGVASTRQEPGTYQLTMRENPSYKARNLNFMLTEENPSISIRLEKLPTVAYTVKVVDAEGNPLQDIFVTIGNIARLQTDASGMAVFELVEDTYTATVSYTGYLTQENVAFPDGSRELTIQLIQDLEASFIEYTVNVKDYDGNVLSGVEVTFYQNNAPIASATTVAGGAVVTKLQPGEYTVGVSGSYHLVSGNTVLTEADPATSLTVVAGVSGTAEELSVRVGNDSYGFPIISQYTAYPVSAGTTYIKLDSRYTSCFVFEPVESGLFEITTIDASAQLSYWGAPSSAGYSSEYSQTLTFNHKDSMMGASYVIAVTGSSDTVLLITREGDYIKNDDDLPWIDYVPKNPLPTPQNISIPSGKKLTYVDVVNGKTSDYKLVVDSSGNYRLNSATGPLVYVHLGAANKVYKLPYMCLSDFIGVTDSYAANTFYQFIYDTNGTKLHKENYVSLLISYCECTKSSSVGLYPLTEDLIHMIQNGGNNKGWYDYDNVNYIFKDSDGNHFSVNEDIAWMFAVCYFE